jgi:WD40 repeat protein
VYGALFSKDERRILSWSGSYRGSIGEARVWDAATGEALLSLRHEGPVLGAMFSKDERRILSWSSDGTARLWDAASGQELLTLRHQNVVIGVVNGAMFSGDERRILSWSDEGTARVWDVSGLPEGHLIDVACGLLPDHDTSGLKDRYGIAITTPICMPGTPPPVAAELQD